MFQELHRWCHGMLRDSACCSYVSIFSTQRPSTCSSTMIPGFNRPGIAIIKSARIFIKRGPVAILFVVAGVFCGLPLPSYAP